MGGKLGEFELLVLLALLELRGLGHGPALQNTLAYAGRRVSLGAICRALHRLEAKGFVAGRWGRPGQQPGGRRKREYRVTSAGLEALRGALTVLHRLYGRSPEHEFVGAVRDSRKALVRFRHMSGNRTLMPSAKTSHPGGALVDILQERPHLPVGHLGEPS